MKRKFLSVLLAACMLGTLLTGCGRRGEGTEEAAASAGDEPRQEVVTLKWYMSLPSVAADTAQIIEKLNEYTRDKIGVEIDYRPMSDSDYMEKMPTYINSGEDFDICFTSNWSTDYLQFAQRDAFLDLSELLPEYAAKTWSFIPEQLWKAVSVDGAIYGIPSYKEMGWQGGIYVNGEMAREYGIDLSRVKTLEDYTEVLKTVSEKAKAENRKVIGISGLSSPNGFALLTPYESLVGNGALPGASAVGEYKNFTKQPEVFNQYETQEYMDYCKTVYEWNKAGYLPADPLNYDQDTANRDNDFSNGTLFSYAISYAPGAAQAAVAQYGHEVTFIPLMTPLLETRSGLGGLLAVSSGSRHPQKAVEFLNLLNTDEYVGTLIRHGIEGTHYSVVGETQIDKTMGGSLDSQDNGYDYTFGWQFGSPFNQKWDVSYPENIEELFQEYNASAVAGSHLGFTFDSTRVNTEISALTNIVAEYASALETGMVNPEEKIPEFLEALKANGADNLLQEVETQLNTWKENGK
ncbi:MAG: ABC transporter substrate-binding protein [Lachnospiraceae bacterium]|nr:ABC transporter substrate-binding protein [Lachnospiraceae bacterium]MDY5700020.1 ABC transporter substrate-binding protein [Lachnospiraceae bacterium]